MTDCVGVYIQISINGDELSAFFNLQKGEF